MASPDQVNKNLEALAALFPNCITETENGKAVDFDLLKQELSHQVIEGSKERYRLEWPGKREAIVTANLPTTKTLRPVRADSLNFDETENLYIEGDNLEVLKLLQESYFGKIKMIYIDPPYNTGNDFVYKDNFAQATEEFKEESGLVDEQNQRLVANPETSGRYHSDWLSMMYSRLKLARNLLTEEGMILLSIDDNEIHNLRKLCDEILGEENFIECFIWKKRYGGGAKEKFIVNLHEYILFYCKNRSILNTIEVANNPEFIAKYYTKKDQFFNERGPYRTQPLEAAKSMGERKNLVYEIPGPDGVSIWPKRQWLWSKERTYDALKRDGLEFNVDSVGKYTVNIKQYLRDEDGNEKTLKVTSIIEEIFTQHGTKEIESIFGRVDYFSYPKPSELIKVLLKFGLKEGGIILDFFSGSATTAHAVMQLNAEDGVNRKFIMVQLPEAMDEKSEAYNAGYKNICDIGKDRIRRVGKKIQEELAQKKSKELDFSGQEPKQLDTGFRVYRLDSSNMQDVYYRPQDYQQDQLDIFADNIKPDRTADDLLAQVMLDWGLPLFYKIEPLLVLDKKVFRVAQDSLLACFDKGIDEAFAKEIASYKPLRIVFRDQSFKDDTAKENVRQLLKQLSPDTEMRVI
ncbi:site-specific DNA-methyltransferase [Siphonobacter sp. SORGH_AS_0500]|uniref:site-specific DNA-methyltransferase n=1 Tax=Siphonobacter sp. SORGH_AS_0500 TaxID=1864824 RepID=UPI00285A8AA5|nr:site-specific DNA-methyltransferase [Siphonobacter sp. SORGH_AS_0500]MDR6193295.1 adenine-specific DNA-methyltransferase [Siphonobacter sp. SORGH_AS_0500]